MRSFPRSARWLAVPVAVVLAVCGKSSPTVPASPGTVGPSPTATPIATVTPLPPLSSSCSRLGSGSATARCPFEQASFQKELDDSINEVRGQKPQLFNGDQILSTGQFLIQLIKNLDAKGLCAGWDGEELAIKNTDAWNDQYDITTASGLVRSGAGSYRSTCYPAAWPLNEGAPAPTPDCPKLPPSQSITCDRENSLFYPDVEAALEQLLKDKPQLFDFTDLAPRTDWPRVVDLNGYTQGLTQILKAKGYCAIWDGAEYAVKNTSQFNEQFAVLLSDAWVRRGEGIYRTTCWPSAF